MNQLLVDFRYTFALTLPSYKPEELFTDASNPFDEVLSIAPVSILHNAPISASIRGAQRAV
ncbi:hypothetical protein CPB85DRAFT_1292683 [Mucidula mucida]|nr:hypothetical protein CPB85DRAFT_1292683 [Mucidula mucida]